METQSSVTPPHFIVVNEVMPSNGFNIIYFDDYNSFYNTVDEGASVYVDKDNNHYAFGEGFVHILLNSGE